MKNKYLSLFLLNMVCLSTLQAQEYLSKNKQNILEYSLQQSKEDNNKLTKDWINPIYYKYIYNQGDKYTTTRSFISISQPIFKSGGIYYAIKYAQSMDRYSKISIEAQKKELIKKVINLLFEMKKNDLAIQKQTLAILNSQLDIQRKKEQVLNGILDTSFLDNSILDSNLKRNILVDLEYKKETLINQLANVSDKKYEQFVLPILSVVSQEEYLQNNIYIKTAKASVDNEYWLKNMTISQYMPTINFTADYTKYHDTDHDPKFQTTEYKNIGFNITIPIDIRVSNSIQSKKIQYMKKRLEKIDKHNEELLLFKNSNAKVRALDKKIQLATSDLELYSSLLTQLVEQKDVGMKTQSDVDTMQNSKKMKEIDIQMLNIDKQIQLLEIYSRVNTKA